MSEARKIPRDRIPGRTLRVFTTRATRIFRTLEPETVLRKGNFHNRKNTFTNGQIDSFSKAKSCGYNYKFLILFIKICHEKAVAHRQP